MLYVDKFECEVTKDDSRKLLIVEHKCRECKKVMHLEVNINFNQDQGGNVDLDTCEHFRAIELTNDNKWMCYFDVDGIPFSWPALWESPNENN